MRGLYLFLLLAFVGFGSWWLVQNNNAVRDFLEEYIGQEENTQFLALKPRYSFDQIVEIHRKELPEYRKNERLVPTLKLYPYLLLDITYKDADKKNRDSVILWSMDDGEMILNTESWDTTEGFGQLLAVDAADYDYKVVKALSSRGGMMRRDQLIRTLSQPVDIVDEWVESTRSKKIVMQDGNSYRLRNPDINISVAPITRIDQRLITNPYNHAVRQVTKYSKDEISQAATAAFPNITIHNVHEVFLPVYSIAIASKDGTVQSTYWNALNGKKYIPQNKGINAKR